MALAHLTPTMTAIGRILDDLLGLAWSRDRPGRGGHHPALRARHETVTVTPASRIQLPDVAVACTVAVAFGA